MRDSSTPNFSLAISTTFERISSLVIRFLLRKEYPSASERQSPVNHEHLAGNVRSVLTYKKRHNFGNVARCSSPPERNTGKIRGYDLIVKRACHVCLHKSRRNDIDSDPPCPQLFRRRLRKSDNACLARRVVGLPGVPSQPDHRRDQYDAPGFLTHHIAGSCPLYDASEIRAHRTDLVGGRVGRERRASQLRGEQGRRYRSCEDGGEGVGVTRGHRQCCCAWICGDRHDELA